jgi:hypothetical protein
MQINVYWHHTRPKELGQQSKVELVAGRPLSLDEAIAALLDMEVNIAVGHLVYLAAGRTVSPWSCAP